MSAEEKWVNSPDSAFIWNKATGEHRPMLNGDEVARLLNEREKYRAALEALQNLADGILTSDRGPTISGLGRLKNLAEEALK